MAGFGPIVGLQLTLALQVRPGEFVPGAGQQFSGQVVARPEGLAIQTPQGSFNLPPGSGLAPGAPVRVEVFLQQGKPAIRVTPVAQTAPSSSSSPAAPSSSPAAPSSPVSPSANVPPPAAGSATPAPPSPTNALPPAPAPPLERPMAAPRPLDAVPRSPMPPTSTPAASSPAPPQTPRAAEFRPSAEWMRAAAPAAPDSPRPPVSPPSAAPVPQGAPHTPASSAQTALPASMAATAEPEAPAAPHATHTAAALRTAVFIPHAAVHYPAAVSRLLQIVAAPAELNDDFGGFIRILAQVFGRSTEPPDGADALQRWVLPDDMSDADALAAVVKRNVESGLRTPEGVLGRERPGAGQPQAPAESFRALVASMLENDGLLGALRDAGLVEDFGRGAERLLDRTAGGQLHNLRAIDGPYVFAALPAMAGAGLRHAQLHIFGDGRSNGGEDAPIRVHLDLELTALGPMWIALNLHGAQCACTIRSASPEICALVEAHGGELEDALRAAGYRNARCIAAPWHGDRLRELAAALQEASPGWDADA